MEVEHDIERRSGVSPRTLIRVMVALIVVAVGVIGVLVWPRDTTYDGVELQGFSATSTETVSAAGVFPPEGRDALENPLAIETDGERFFIAESGAGVIRVFTENGGPRGEIVIVPADDADTSYPADIALIDDETLAVVDTAANRVVLAHADPAEDDAVFAQVGEEGAATAPIQPSAVAVVGGRLLIADAADGTLKRYDLTGRYLDTVGLDMDPPLGVIGSLCECAGRLFVSDSTSGRVLILDAETGAPKRVLDKLMDLPRGVTNDEMGLTYVADRFAPSIEVFDADGLPTESFGNGSRTEITLAMPTDVAWHMQDSRLYVVDASVGRIAVFNIRADGGGS